MTNVPVTYNKLSWKKYAATATCHMWFKTDYSIIQCLSSALVKKKDLPNLTFVKLKNKNNNNIKKNQGEVFQRRFCCGLKWTLARMLRGVLMWVKCDTHPLHLKKCHANKQVLVKNPRCAGFPSVR